MASEEGFWTEAKGGTTEVENKAISELIRLSEDEGVAGWTHPALFSPLQPVVLTEGYRDFKALSHACKILGKSSFRVTYLPDLDKGEPKGGKDNINAFLKRSQRYIANRPANCPLIILLDWDISDAELKIAQKSYGANGEKYVARMSKAMVNNDLSSDFFGIERFYPTSCITEQVTKGAFAAAKTAAGIYTISKSQLEKAKDPLLESLLKIKDPSSIENLSLVIKSIENILQ